MCYFSVARKGTGDNNDTNMTNHGCREKPIENADVLDPEFCAMPLCIFLGRARAEEAF